MKRTILTIGVLAVLFSCKKKEEELNNNSEASYQGSATVSGLVQAELNTTNSEMETAPQGTVILIEYDEEDLILNPQPGVNYQKISVVASVDSTGYYRASIPTNGKAVSVNVIPQDFQYNKIISDSLPAERTVYSSAPTNISVLTSTSKIVDVNY